MKSALSKPQARLLGAEVPCNYIYGRLRDRTSEPFRKADFTPSRQFIFNRFIIRKPFMQVFWKIDYGKRIIINL